MIATRLSVTALVPALALSLAACVSDLTTPEGSQEATLHVQADLGSASIAMVVIEVTAPDIPEPLVFNIPIENGVASGTITIPAGSDRTITMRAFDENGIETHNGAVTVDIDPGASGTISITLNVAVTDVEIVITLENIVVTVEPASASIEVGATVQLGATIEDQNGNSIPGTVHWATADPAVASVDQSGLVTGEGEGETQIVASFAAIAGIATITVIAGS